MSKPTAMDRLDPAPAPEPEPEPGPREPGENEAGVLSDLQDFPVKMRQGAHARSALFLARELDAQADGMMPRDKASYVQRITVNIDKLRELAPGEAKGDSTDDRRNAREERLLRAVE